MSKMNCSVLTILIIILSVTSVAFAYESLQLDIVNGKKYLNREYEIETEDGTLQQVNGEIVGLISKRKLSETEQQQLEEQINEIQTYTNQIMENTMTGINEMQQNIQNNINEMNNNINKLWSNHGYYSNNHNFWPQNYYNGYDGNNLGVPYV